jgi:YVTN family beta-propeller protein
MKLNNVFFGIFASALLLASCSNDDSIEKDSPLGAYDNGVLILNEGNFGTPNASVSYISNDLTVFMQDVFGTENSAKVLGDVAQSLSFYEDKAFIVMNNSNTVEVVNRYTFKSIASITENLKNPRYSVALNGKLYVTNSGSKAVTVYDAKTFAYAETIAIGKTSEKIITANGKLYVMNGAYGSGSTVTVINPQSNNAMSVITVENGVNSIEEKNGSVYVLCGNTTKSKLFKINTNNDTATSIESATLTKALNMDIDGDKIYYTKGTGVYAMALNATTFSETPLFSVADNSWSTLYGFNVINGKVYTADANGFTAAGIVKISTTTGTELKTVAAGMGPNSFYSNN